MFKNENPALLAGGNRAGTLQAGHAVDIRESLRYQAQRRLRRQHLARHLHRLGARALFEFIDEIDRVHGLGDDLDRRLEKFGNADPRLLTAVGADQFPALPVRLVGGAS